MSVKFSGNRNGGGLYSLADLQIKIDQIEYTGLTIELI